MYGFIRTASIIICEYVFYNNYIFISERIVIQICTLLSKLMMTYVYIVINFTNELGEFEIETNWLMYMNTHTQT